MGAPAFERHPALGCLLRDELVPALLAVVASASSPSSASSSASSPSQPPLLAAACGLSALLLVRLRGPLKAHVATLLAGALLPLASSPAPDASRVGLEALAHLAAVAPLLPAEIYANFDCDVRCPPLWDRLCASLAKAAFPAPPPPPHLPLALSPSNGVAVEALSSLLSAMADRTLHPLPHLPGRHGGGGGDGGGSGPFGFPPPQGPPRYDPSVWANPGRFAAAASASAASGDVAGAAATLAGARALRDRVATAAEMFNLDAGKGLTLLRASGLLPPEEGDALADAPGVAAFLRHGAGLDKAAVGEYLGEPGPRVAAVLRHYAALHDFGGVPLDAALRSFLHGFLLPGEAQKIARCLEAFAARFFACNAGGVAANADAAYVLSYSIIMLNTDLHNAQVRVKMTRDQFVRNNRGTNGDADWPRDYLEGIYEAISADAIKLTDGLGQPGGGPAGAPSSGAPSPAATAASNAASSWPGGVGGRGGDGGPDLFRVGVPLAAALDAQLFSRLWGPAINAFFVAFEHGPGPGCGQADVLADAGAGLASTARVAAAHGLPHVSDHAAVTAVRAAASGLAAGAAAFGCEPRSRAAAATAFAIAHRSGDALRAAWQPLVELLLKMHAAGCVALPSAWEAGAAAAADNAGGPASASSAATAAPRHPSASPAASMSGEYPFRRAPSPPPPAARAPSSGLLRGFSSLLSLDTEPPLPPPPQQLPIGSLQSAPSLPPAQPEWARACRECGDACRVPELVADSLFLEAPSLTSLGKACCAVGESCGSVGDAPGAASCVDLLAALSLRNAERADVLWPATAPHLRKLVASTTASPASVALCERSVAALLRLAARCLPAHTAVADEALDALRLVLSLDARAADCVMPRVASEARRFAESPAARLLSSPAGWDTLGRLLGAAALHVDASGDAFAAVAAVVGPPPPPQPAPAPPPLPPPPAACFGPCAAALAAFACSKAGGEGRSRSAVALLASATIGVALQQHEADGAAGAAAAWADGCALLRRCCCDERADVRDDAVHALLRSLLSASHSLAPPASLLLRLFDAALLPLFGELVDGCRSKRGRDPAPAERSLAAAVPLLVKPFLAFLPVLALELKPEDLHRLWAAVVERLAAAARAASSPPSQSADELSEAVVEALKNCVLVMHASGVLTREGTPELWAFTWKRAAAISPLLTPAILAPREPRPKPPPPPAAQRAQQPASPRSPQPPAHDAPTAPHAVQPQPPSPGGRSGGDSASPREENASDAPPGGAEAAREPPLDQSAALRAVAAVVTSASPSGGADAASVEAGAEVNAAAVARDVAEEEGEEEEEPQPANGTPGPWWRLI